MVGRSNIELSLTLPLANDCARSPNCLRTLTWLRHCILCPSVLARKTVRRAF